MNHLSQMAGGSGRLKRLLKRIGILVGLASLAALTWILWGSWPDPKPGSLPWKPDVILILGGGDDDRVREGKLLADRYQDTPVVVTGDGGIIVKGLLDMGISNRRIVQERKAESTYDNAIFTAPLLERLNARRIVIVTNWFHVPRALAVFRHEQPTREFAASFEEKSEPLTLWDRGSQRRERVAALLYLFRYGIWSW